MKTLETKFTSEGFNFTLIKREGPVALLSKRREHWPEALQSYEVVVVQTHKAEKIKSPQGVWYDYPEREAMPPSESWGTHGWTCMDREAAERRFVATTKAHGNAIL